MKPLRMALAAALGLLSSSLLLAQTTTQKTKPSQIGPQQGRTPEQPRPATPNVCVQHTITLDAKTGEAKLKAKFTNKDCNNKKFVFCQMVGIRKDEVSVTGACDVFYDADAMKIKCMRSTRRFDSFVDSFHFGCKEVSLGPSEMKEIDYGSGQHDKFKGKKAADFFVTYGDYVALPEGASFDPDSCNGCFGQDTSTGRSRTQPSDMMGTWYMPLLPFDDPYLKYQSIDGTPSEEEYRSFSMPLGTPSNFPVTVPQLPRNVPEPIPEFYSGDLNLFDIYTMGEGGSPETVSLSVGTDPPMPGIFETQPRESEVFTIPGEAELFGRLTIHRPSELPEGVSTELAVTTHLPDRPGVLGDGLFAQNGFFIQDTHTPNVVDHQVRFSEDRLLHVELIASDDTTSPIAADFWFSTDGGNTWDSQQLSSSSNLFEDIQQRTFIADVGPFPPRANVLYFLTVQDEVFNMVFFGIGQVTAP